MRAQCKAFDVVTGAQLEDEFNAWHAAMEQSVPGFCIVQSHLIKSSGGPLLVVFWARAMVITPTPDTAQ